MSYSNNSDEDELDDPVNISGLALFLTTLTCGIYRFFTVPQGYVRIITAFDRFVRVAKPGLGACVSFWGLYQKPESLVSKKEQVRDYPRESVFTKDGVSCRIDSVIFFKIDDPKKAIFEIENYENAIRNLVRATLRNECGNLAARELLSGRQKLAERLRTNLESDTDPWGLSVRLVEITGIEMSSSPEK